MGIVWILGAGFSKPLGGPLLPQLLSRTTEARVRARFPHAADAIFDERWWPTLRGMLAKHGWQNPDPASRVWGDAEEFLEFLDLAKNSADQSALRELRAYAGPPFTTSQDACAVLAATAKRVVAAECCFFRDETPEYEKWRPYKQWATNLSCDETVITFNYDRVVETVARSVGQTVDTMVGHDINTSTGTPLLKLHGSVDWQNDEVRGIVPTQNPNYAVHAPASEELAIASPGPSKATFRKQLKSLWSRAGQAIATADAIVIVGYRIPESDADARGWLVEAITQSGRDGCPEMLPLHIVLGPDNSHTRRVEEILRHALRKAGRGDHTDRAMWHRRYRLKVHPLYAQDFLGLVTRDEVLHPT
jgi:SIR2-like domain